MVGYGFIVFVLLAIIILIWMIINIDGGVRPSGYCHTHGCGAGYYASDGKCIVCRREIDDFEQMKRQFNKYTCREVTMSKHWYVKSKNGGFVEDGANGRVSTFETRGEALAKAQELARRNTSVTYLVIGPSDEVSANIPVDVKEWKQ